MSVIKRTKRADVPAACDEEMLGVCEGSAGPWFLIRVLCVICG